MSSFLNIFGGSAENTEADISVDKVAIDIKESDVDNVVDGNQIGSVIESGTNWIKEHPIFVLWAVVAIAGLVYLAYFRNTDPDEVAAEGETEPAELPGVAAPVREPRQTTLLYKELAQLVAIRLGATLKN